MTPIQAYFKAPDSSRTASSAPVMEGLLLEALKRLDAKLGEAGMHPTLWMIGGGCMMMHFDARESSGDLDVIPAQGDFPQVLLLAEEVARELGTEGKRIPADWINGDFAPQFRTLNAGPKDFEADPRYSWTNLDIRFAKAELMLALKCFSLRSEGSDIPDLRFLMNAVPVRDLDHLYDIIEHYGDIDMLGNGDDEIIESLFREVRGQREVTQ